MTHQNLGESSVFKYFLTLGIVAMEGRGFEYPKDTWMSNSGRIYVPSQSRDYGERGVRITMLDINSEFFGTFGHYGTDPGRLISPTSITANAEQELFICDDYTDLVSVFDVEGKFIRRWGQSGTEPGYLSGPSSISFDSDWNLLISDTRNHRIQKFSQDGELIALYGNEGRGEVEFDLPWGITCDTANNIYVCDWGNNRIQKLDVNGKYIGEFTSAGSRPNVLNHPSSIAITNDGYLCVADWGNETVKLLDQNDNLIQELRGEAGLSKWAQDFMNTNQEEHLARESANLEVPLDFLEDRTPHAESAHIEKYFWSPVSVKLDQSGMLHVTDSNRHRIQVYQPES